MSEAVKRHDDFPDGWVGLDWYALRARPATERLVADRLGSLGVPCAVPIKIEYRRRSRVAKTKEAVTLPVLTGYVFAAVAPGRWGAVLGVRHVSGVLGVEGVPTRMRAAQLAAFCRRSAAGAFSAPEHQRHMRTGREFSVGQKVEVFGTRTPFDGRVVEVAELRGEVAQVVMQMLGSTRTVAVGLDRLVAA